MNPGDVARARQKAESDFQLYRAKKEVELQKLNESFKNQSRNCSTRYTNERRFYYSKNRSEEKFPIGHYDPKRDA